MHPRVETATIMATERAIRGSARPSGDPLRYSWLTHLRHHVLSSRTWSRNVLRHPDRPLSRTPTG